MKLKLIQTGGVVGKTLTAVVNSKLKEKELAELVAAVKKKATRGAARDAFSYVLQQDDDEKSGVAIDINAIPARHTELFKALFENLKAEK